MDSKLNKEQELAVSTTEGPLLILAGAGAGKTKTIVERIRALVRKGVAPSSILAITFTNKAAKEMRGRVLEALRTDPTLNRPISIDESPFISTFHALGVYILRQFSHLTHLNKHFAIFDREDSKKAIKESLTLLGLDPKVYDSGKILGIISREKGRGTGVDEYLANSDRRSFYGEAVAIVWPEYEKILKRDQGLDFDDLLLLSLRLLREKAEVREYYQKLWRYVHIDEYQDTSRVQYEISKLLVGPEKNICAVGDIDQNIYSWRGAELKNILAFEDDYSEALIVTLEENYRSTKNILSAANAVIEKNKVRRPKNLFTQNSDGEKIYLNISLDEASEADFVAEKAQEFIQSGVSPKEIAVLYRANFQSRALEEAFLRSGTPYQILGLGFFERKEVKDIISYLRASLNPESLGDLKRIINVPARGIGKTTIAKIFSGQKSALPPNMKAKLDHFYTLLKKIKKTSEENLLSETIAYIVKESGLEEEFKKSGDEGIARLENAYELANFAKRYDHLSKEGQVDQFLTDSALQSDQDEIRVDEPLVRLMTVHASKGLEFDVVFITGLEEGLFPHERSNDGNRTREEAEEERRLFYVALTRARKNIFLSYAELRTVFGKQNINMPSQFLLDIPAELVEESGFNSVGVPEGKKPLLEIDF